MATAPQFTTALEQSFADLCAEHDLTALSVSYCHKFESFAAYAHADGCCDSGSDRVLAVAIGTAIGLLNVRRGKGPHINLADQPLAVELAA